MNKNTNVLQIISPEQEFNFVATPGQSVRQLLEQLPEWQAHESLAVYNHGHQIKDIDGFIVNDGDRLIVCLVPMGGGGGGGKSIVTIVAAIAIIAVAWWNPMGWAASGALLSQATLYAVGGSLLLSGVGTMIAPKPNLSTGNVGSSQRESSYFITGQSNSAKPYSPVLVAYGQNKIFPVLAASPNIINVGGSSTFDSLYDFGIGEQQFDLSQIKIGETLANQYDPEYYLHTNTKTPNLVLITNRYGYQDFAVRLELNDPFIASTKAATINAEVNITFTQGMYTFDNNGNVQVATADFKVDWRLPGGSWTVLKAASFFGAAVYDKVITETIETEDGTITNTYPTDEITVAAATTAPFVVIGSIVFPAANGYEIRVTRTSPNSTNTRTQNTATLTLVESRVTGNVLNLAAPHTMLEMRVRANDRLSGVVQNLSVISTSVLNQYDNIGNLTRRAATRNPAWIAIDILIGAANPRPIRHAQIDWPAWKALADICDAQRTWIINGQSVTTARFICDVVVDYSTTIKELLEGVLSTCRASLTIGLNGRYSVMYDGARTIPRQLITPSNSWNFSASRQFPADTHALRVSFIDEVSGYRKQEVLVYRDGYDASNAKNLEDLGTFGVSTFNHAWAFGRYMMAAAITRSEVFTITMDVENLACQRGDLVHVAHDVPMIGGQPTHVVSINGNTVEVTEDLGLQPNAFTVRLSSGTIRQGLVTKTVSSNVFELDDVTGIQVDDLIVLGQSDRVTEPYIVSQVSPSMDLTASLTLLPYVPAVYDADIGLLPEWNPEFSEDLINASKLKITFVNSSGQRLVYKDRMPYADFIITWGVNDFAAVGYYDLIISTANGQKEVITGLTSTRYEYSVSLADYPYKIGNVTFEVIPYTPSGIPGESGFVTDTIVPDRIAPAPVNWFLLNVQDMNIALSWEPPLEQDIANFEIRYSPEVANANWNSSQLIGIFAHNVTRTMVGARTGSYGICVRDTSNNLSTVTGRKTTIEELPGINLVSYVNDAVAWEGSCVGTEVVDTNVQLSGDWGSITPEGFYYYKNVFDAGQIYELRIVSKLQSHGSAYDDFMALWVPLAYAKPLSSSQSTQFNVMLEVRTANQFPFMVNWIPLASAIPIKDVDDKDWSDWRPCEVGDFTGRIFQFRIRMQSYDPNIRAIIDDGLIEIDVRDRIDRFSDLAITNLGLDVNFDPAFMDPPTLAVTTENTNAVRHVISNKTRTGFRVQLFDESGDAVPGQVDVLALGYGRERLISI